MMPYYVGKDIKPDFSDKILRKGESYSIRFDGEGLNKKNHHRLYFTCEDRMHYMFKDEPYGDKLYMLIEDSLNTEKALYDRYCLDLSEKCFRPFPKRAVTKLLWNSCIGVYDMGEVDEKWHVGIFAKAENLVIGEGGYLRLRYESWYKKQGVHPAETGASPDEIILIDIPEGSYDYTEFADWVKITEKTACIIVTVEGMGYQGEIYVERPHLTASNGDNLLPAFDVIVPCERDYTNVTGHSWLGQSLSKKEWPQFRMQLNGTVFFEGETFLRIHRYSPVEITIPDGLLQEENELTITYISDYRDTVPLAIREMKLLEKEKAPYHLHFCPETAVYGKEIPLLIETEQDHMSFSLKSDVLRITGESCFEKKGLHVLKLTGEHYSNHMEFVLLAEGCEVAAEIRKVIVKAEDHVVCGSGDLIYIDNSDVQAVSDYIEWTLANKIDNLLTIRPAYRWGGHRVINPAVWELFCRICNEMGIDYVNMSDGRDLPGQQCNPSPRMLAGEHYQGLQLHERDGQLFYWAVTPKETCPTTDVFFDLLQRFYRESPDTTEKTFRTGNILMQRGTMALRRDIDCRPDMKEAHDCALHALRILQGGDVPRHTGPSVMFKYFYEAGFEWTGAETMDSAVEPLLAFLRGAAKVYGKTRTGVHHAVQWSTQPHDTEERYRRYMLANYVPYMQGATDINTEEGFWFLEARYTYHNRFSPACKNHVAQQKKLYRFITNHSRTGRYEVTTALIHGRYDGWNGFSGRNLFGMPQLQAGDAERSWKLLKIFYPLCRVEKEGMATVGNYPEGYGKPIGLLSGTPRGNVDVVPMEKGDYSEYKLLCFAGYNAAEAEDMDRLYRYTAEGGILVACWPHFSTVTYRPDIEEGRINVIQHPLTMALTDEIPVFTDGMCVNITKKAAILSRTENGIPLVAEVPVGKGRVVLVNTVKYPGEETILPIYQDLILKLHTEIAAEEAVEVICGEDVEYTRYLQEDGSVHLYITPVDWYNDPAPKRYARLRIGKDLYDISLNFGAITKIVVKDGIAAWPAEEDFEVLSVNPVKVQGDGRTTVYIAGGGTVAEKTIDIEKEAVII